MACEAARRVQRARTCANSPVVVREEVVHVSLDNRSLARGRISQHQHFERVHILAGGSSRHGGVQSDGGRLASHDGRGRGAAGRRTARFAWLLADSALRRPT